MQLLGLGSPSSRAHALFHAHAQACTCADVPHASWWRWPCGTLASMSATRTGSGFRKLSALDGLAHR